jgi:hypothetical protein
MQLLINNERTLSEVQQEFNDAFPYLKLEFFSKLHAPGKPSRLKFMLPSHKKIGLFRKREDDTPVAIVSGMTVTELEQLLEQKLGFGVQVFRKSGGIWLETVLTDTWTLAEQNQEGAFLGTDIEPEKPEDPSDRN